MGAIETVHRLRDEELPQAITDRDELVAQRDQAETAARQAVIDKELALDDPERYRAAEQDERANRVEVERLDRLIARTITAIECLELEIKIADVALAAAD